VSIQRYYIYAERGLASRRVSVWLYDDRLHIEYQHRLLARYSYRYERRSANIARIWWTWPNEKILLANLLRAVLRARTYNGRPKQEQAHVPPPKTNA
jgi:hypothetical protein